MRINNLSFPHPVLGNSDDVGGIFKATLDVALLDNHADLKISCFLSNETLEGLISRNMAKFNVEIVCRQTFYRESFLTENNELNLSIPSDKLRNKVDLNFFITATADITDYQITESNRDYKGYKFEVANGDVLGYGGSTSFFAAKDWGALSTVTSFMEIEQGDTDTGPLAFRLSDKKVFIVMPKEDYKMYQRCKGNSNLYSTIHSSIVFPALMYILQNMDALEDYRDDDWYQNLEFRLSNDERLKNLDRSNPENIIKIAQLLLGNPVYRMLSDADKLTEIPVSE